MASVIEVSEGPCSFACLIIYLPSHAQHLFSAEVIRAHHSLLLSLLYRVVLLLQFSEKCVLASAE